MVDGIYCQLPNNSHDPEDWEHDTNGANVLIADMSEPFYFGRNCQIPEGGWEMIGFVFSKGRTFYRDTDSDLKNIRHFLHTTQGSLLAYMELLVFRSREKIHLLMVAVVRNNKLGHSIKILFLLVGIDRGCGGTLSPRFSDGTFEYVPVS